MEWQLSRTDTQVLEVRQKYNVGDTAYFLLTSDVHYDNPQCNRELYYQHLDEAVRRKAGIFCFGDFFCLMQGKFDRRGHKNKVRPEHNTAQYFDDVILNSAETLEKWKDNFIAFTDGNHETNVVKNVETNPLSRMVDRMNLQYKANVFHLPYQGFVRFRFEHNSGGQIRSKLLAFHHGNWGGIVSKGVQSVARYSSIFPQADVFVSGHTHDYWVVPDVRYWVDQKGKVQEKWQYHVKTGTYKDEFMDGSGWAVQKIVKPKPLGGWWMRIDFGSKATKISFEMAK